LGWFALEVGSWLFSSNSLVRGWISISLNLVEDYKYLLEKNWTWAPSGLTLKP
jgi:hypothetical protein